MQNTRFTTAPSTADGATAVPASYSPMSLLRRALLGLFLIVAFTSTSAWLLHATTEPTQTSVTRAP